MLAAPEPSWRERIQHCPSSPKVDACHPKKHRGAIFWILHFIKRVGRLSPFGYIHVNAETHGAVSRTLGLLTIAGGLGASIAIRPPSKNPSLDPQR